MIRIRRCDLDAIITAIIEAADNATDASDHRIIFVPSRKTVEAMVLGAMSIIAPGGGPVTADDVFFVTNWGQPDQSSWPPRKNNDGSE